MKNTFRYSNLSDTSDLIDYDLPLIQKHLRKRGLLPYEGCIDSTDGPLVRIDDLMERWYCFGRRMEDVYSVLRMKIELTWKALDEIDQNPKESTIAELGLSRSCLPDAFASAVLIDDNYNMTKLAEKLDRTIDRINKRDLYCDYARLCLQLILRTPCSESEIEAVDKGLRGLEVVPRSDWRFLLIARGKGEQFNRDLQEDIVQVHHRPESRRRRMKNLCSEVFSIWALYEVAFALHCGIEHSFRDPAVPIWDFPVGRKYGIGPKVNST